MTAAKGWAVKRDGVIDVRTVSPTRRGALVNVLHLLVHPIFSTASDEVIEELWQGTYKKRGWSLIEVTIIEGALQ